MNYNKKINKVLCMIVLLFFLYFIKNIKKYSFSEKGAGEWRALGKYIIH